MPDMTDRELRLRLLELAVRRNPGGDVYYLRAEADQYWEYVHKDAVPAISPPSAPTDDIPF